MNNLLHKMCEKAEAELWELISEDEWCLAHAEAAYYFVEIIKAIKKIDHLENLDEAMERFEEEEEESTGKRWKQKEWRDEIPMRFTYHNEDEWKRKYEEEKKKNEELMRKMPPPPPTK